MKQLHSLKSLLAAATILTTVWAGVTYGQDAATDMTSGVPSAKDIVRALTIDSTSKDAQQAVDLDVKFAFNSAQLTPEAETLLDVLSLAMKAPELASLSFRVEGHTDAIGSAVYNQRLSEARATSAYGYLVQHGVEAARLEAKGLGMSQPLDAANPAAAKNRRVRIVSFVSNQQTMTTTTTTTTTTSPQPPVTTIPVKFNYKLHLFAGGAGPGQVADPVSTTFKTGDKFYLEFGSSVTGLFDLWNLSPGGTVTKLGRWPSDAMKPLRLPSDGTQIKFSGETGQELLVVQYYPCKVAGERNLELAPEAEQAMVDCGRIGEVPFKDDRGRNLEIVSGPEGGSAETQVELDTTQSWTTTMVQFTIPLKHQ